MSYKTLATSKTPALIIYLLDISASMDKSLGQKSRLTAALDALNAALKTMVFRSSKGSTIQPRYRVAVYLYSDEVYDLLGGIKTVDEVIQMEFPKIDTGRGTDTALAFAAAGELLAKELPHMLDHPAPLICHLTDDVYTGQDPEPIVNALKQMRNRDGNVLIENIYISNKLGADFSGDEALQWPGIHPDTDLDDNYAQKLRAMSSTLPESYFDVLEDMGSKISKDAVMMFPGNTLDFISLAFQMSAATGVSRNTK